MDCYLTQLTAQQERARKAIAEAQQERARKAIAEAQDLKADLAYNELKNSGELQRPQDHRALQEQLRWA